MDALFVWVARGLLCVFLVVDILGIGWIQQRTRSYPGKSTIRLLWLGKVNPWRVKEVETDFLRHGFPATFSVFTITLVGIGTATYFMSPLLLSGAFQFLLFVVVLILVIFVSTRINEKGSHVVAALGPTTGFSGVLLLMGSLFGFSPFYLLLAVNPVIQLTMIIIGLIILCWQFIALFFVSSKVLEISLMSSLGRLLIVIGFVLMMGGVTIGALGPTGINSLILQLTMFPSEFLLYLQQAFQICFMLCNPWNPLIIGFTLTIVGVLLAVIDFLRRPQIKHSELEE
jgi:hypothetical protein